jgi:hypothetical protein
VVRTVHHIISISLLVFYTHTQFAAQAPAMYVKATFVLISLAENLRFAQAILVSCRGPVFVFGRQIARGGEGSASVLSVELGFALLPFRSPVALPQCDAPPVGEIIVLRAHKLANTALSQVGTFTIRGECANTFVS